MESKNLRSDSFYGRLTEIQSILTNTYLNLLTFKASIMKANKKAAERNCKFQLKTLKLLSRRT